MSAMEECGTIPTSVATLPTLHEPLDALPADQKSVLQLLLRQGKNYDDLSGLLRLDADESARAPTTRSTRWDPVRAACPPSAGTRSPTGCWASGIPRSPPPPAPSSTARRRDACGPTVSPASSSRSPATACPICPAEAPRRGRGACPGPQRRCRRRPHAHAEDAPTPFAPAATAGPRVSRRGGAAAHRRRARRRRHRRRARHRPQRRPQRQRRRTAPRPRPPTPPRPRPSRRSAPRSTCTPPKGAPVKKAVAIVQFVDVNGQQAINAATQGLPTSKTVVYGLWFFNSSRRRSSSAASTRPTTRVTSSCRASCPRASTSPSYKDLVITREKPSTNPTSPGTIYLRGSIQNAAGG